MLIYRIVISMGYRDAYIDFDDATEASEFATTILSHYKKPDDEKRLLKVVIEVIDPTVQEEEE